MTLWDGKPLTAQEARAYELCTCGHTRGTHRGGQDCTAPFCDCDEFAWAGDTLAAETKP